MPTVVVYCTAPIMGQGLRSIISDIEGFQLSAVCADLAAVRASVTGEQCDIVLLEVNSNMTLDLLAELSRSAPATRIVLWAGTPAMEFISRALAIGVRGILGHTASVTNYADCLRAVHSGQVWIGAEVSSKILGMNHIALTPRQRQLMGLVAQGLRNKEIGWALGISEGTVKVYLSRLFVKVGASDRLELALLALRNVQGSQDSAPNDSSRIPGDRAIPYAIPRSVSIERFRAVA